MAMAETIFKLPFLKKEKLTSDTYSFYFKRTGQERDFVAGQYFELKLNIKDPDERGNTRVFTVCSSPTKKDYFMFTTRILKSSFKMDMLSLIPGQMVEFDGPWNDLNYDEKDKEKKVFLAGGIGITPFHSIIEYCLDRKINNPITLFVSWSQKSEIIFDDFFKDASKLLSNFIYVPTITHTDGLTDWTGEKGRVDSQMLKRYLVKTENYRYYIAGPQSFVKSEKELIKGMGVSDNNIISEDFEGY